MTFDTPQQALYVLNLLDIRRDEVNARMIGLETKFTDMVALHANERYKKLEAERDLNATLTIRTIEAKRRLEKEQVPLMN